MKDGEGKGASGVEVGGQWPPCRACGRGRLIPLSDYGNDGAPVTYKAWACTDEACAFMLRIDKGEVSSDRYTRQSRNLKHSEPAPVRRAY